MNSQVKNAMQVGDGARPALPPPAWPYVNDFLDCRWLPNAPPFQEQAIWIEAQALAPDAAADGKPRKSSKPTASAARPLHLYYRLTPILYAKLIAAVERLEAKTLSQPGGDIASVRAAVDLLLSLGNWLVHDSGAYVAHDLAAARRAVAAGSVAAPKPPASREEIEMLNRATAIDAGRSAIDYAKKWRESWGRVEDGD